jgi:hypothetical protein
MTKRTRRGPDLVIEVRLHLSMPGGEAVAIDALAGDTWVPMVRALLEKAQEAGTRVTMPDLLKALGAKANHPTWARVGRIVGALGWTRRRDSAHPSRPWYYVPPSRARDERSHARAVNGVDA